MGCSLPLDMDDVSFASSVDVGGSASSLVVVVVVVGRLLLWICCDR